MTSQTIPDAATMQHAATDQHADTVTLQAGGDLDAETVELTVAAELMKNQKRTAPLDVTETIEVVQDSDGHPLLFSIGTDGDFRLLRHDSATDTGYEAVDLSDGFSNHDGTADFDVTQDREGTVSVAVALSREGESGTDVFVASGLSNDAGKTDWGRFHTKCAKVEGVDPSFVARNVTIGTTDDGDPAFVVVEGTLDGQEYYYQVDADGSAEKLELPENVDPGDVKEISVGYATGQRGKYFLYDEGDSQTLTCITVADEFEGSEHYDFSPGNEHVPADYRDLTCMATPLGTDTDEMTISSDLYVGTKDGLYVFRNAKASACQTVTDDLEDVHELLVETHGDTVVIWAMTSPSDLYYVTGTRGDSGYEFEDPVLFDDSTVHLAPIRNRRKDANEVFTVTQDRSIGHHWQAPGSTLWQERTISVKDDEFIHDFDSFTTQVTVETGDGEPVAGEKLAITASEWTYAQVNGKLYSFDEDAPADVETDPRGQVTIVDAATDVAAPVFHVTADFLEKTVNIYPNGKIETGLRSIKRGADLKQERTQDGSPVVDGSYDDSTVDAVAYNVHRLSKTAGKHMDGRREDDHTFVSVTDGDEKLTGELTAEDVPQDFSMAMTLNEGSWEPTDADAVASMVGGAREFFGSIGDFFRHIGHAVEDAVERVVKAGEDVVTHLEGGVEFLLHEAEDALQFVLKLGEKTIKYALDTVGKAFKAIDWVLKQVGIDLEKAIEWLGHLFGWEDIWKTHEVIASVITASVDYAVEKADDEIERVRSAVNDAFDGLESALRDVSVPGDLQGEQVRAKAASARHDGPATSLKSPAANRSFYHLQHSGLVSGGSAESSPDFSDQFLSFVDDDVVPAAREIEGALEDDLSELESLFTDESTTVEDVLSVLGNLVDDAVLKPLETVVDGTLDFLEEVLKFVRHVLTESLDVPFLSSFYEWLTGALGEQEELTLVNAVSLVIAIPYTVIFKTAKGRAPFENGTYGLDDEDLFETLLDEHRPNTAVATDGGSTAMTVATAYTKVCGSIAALTNVAQSITNMFRTANVKSKVLQRVDYGLAFATFALGAPIPPNFENWWSFGTRAAGFSIGVLWTCTACGLEEAGVTLPSGWIKGVIHSASLALYLVADGINQANWMNWVADVLTMGGYAVVDFAGVAEQPEVQVAGAGTTFFGSIFTLGKEMDSIP